MREELNKIEAEEWCTLFQRNATGTSPHLALQRRWGDPIGKTNSIRRNDCHLKSSIPKNFSRPYCARSTRGTFLGTPRLRPGLSHSDEHLIGRQVPYSIVSIYFLSRRSTVRSDSS